MAGVIQKFVVASLFMWVAPIAILYAFNNNLLPGKTLNPLPMSWGCLYISDMGAILCYNICMGNDSILPFK